MEILIAIVEFLTKNPQLLKGGISAAIFIAGVISFNRAVKKLETSSDEKFQKLAESQEQGQKHNDMRFTELMDQIGDVQEDMKNFATKQRETHLLTLRGLVTNESLPREYRLKIYDDYIKEGGNSWLTDYVEENLL